MNDIVYIPEKRNIAKEVNIAIYGSDVGYEHGGGGFKQILSVVATVAIIYFSAGIASSIQLSGGIAGAFGGGAAATTAGNALGGAIVGAGLGAVKGAAFGEDISSNALSGAIGGGLTGAVGGGWRGQGVGNAYASAPAASGTTSGIAGATESTGGVGAAAPPLSSGPNPITASPAGPNVGTAISGGANPSVAFGGQPVVGQETAGPGIGTNIWNWTKDVGGVLKERASDPSRAADALVKGGIFAVAQYPQYLQNKEILNQQQQSLTAAQGSAEDQRQREEDVFNLKYEQARNLLNQANQFDPTHSANQAANAANVTAGRAGLQTQRDANLSGYGYSSGDARRAELDRSRNVAGAYDQGFSSGLANQTNTLRAGLNAIPSAPSGYADTLSSLVSDYNELEDRNSGLGAGLGHVFGGWLGNEPKDPTEEELNANKV